MKRVLIFAIIVLLVLAKAKKSKEVGSKDKWTKDDLFLYGMLSGGFVSLIGFIASFLLLFLQKFIPPHIYTVIIQILFAFSCGALLGETMLHILPESYASPHLDDQQVSLTFIAAIIAFLLLERTMEKFGVSDSHWHGEADPS